MIAKLYTSPFCVPRPLGSGNLNSSGALYKRSEKKRKRHKLFWRRVKKLRFFMHKTHHFQILNVYNVRKKVDCRVAKVIFYLFYVSCKLVGRVGVAFTVFRQNFFASKFCDFIVLSQETKTYFYKIDVLRHWSHLVYS